MKHFFIFIFLVLGILPSFAQDVFVGDSYSSKVKTGWIVLDSNPAGASVYINEEYVGKTPLDNFKKPYGDYTYRIEKDKYHTSTGVIKLDKPKYEETVTLSPKRTYGSIDIASTPRGAQIVIDGKNYGTTPNTIEELVEGEHQLKIILDGYATYTQNISISEGDNTAIYVTLQNGRPVTDTPKKANQTITIPGTKVSFTMVPVEGGTFTMGAHENQVAEAVNDEKPTHQVTLRNYYIGETEVTQALWKAVMGNNPSGWKGDNLPVEQVSWYDCQEFVRTLNQKTGRTFRLPTEAEWEYAARGGNQSRGYKYSGSNNVDDVAWYSGNSGKKTHAVKTKQPNELGLYDMSGNVWEWCYDWYGTYSRNSQTNPKGPNSGSYRVSHGGSSGREAKVCRTSDRGGDTPDHRSRSIGLRLVLIK